MLLGLLLEAPLIEPLDRLQSGNAILEFAFSLPTSLISFLLFLVVFQHLTVELENDVLKLITKLLNAGVLLPDFLVDTQLQLHVIEQDLGILFETLVLQLKAAFEHLGLLPNHVSYLHCLEMLLFELLVNLPESINLATARIVGDHHLKLL
jgi:hypothetical protein